MTGEALAVLADMDGEAEGEEGGVMPVAGTVEANPAAGVTAGRPPLGVAVKGGGQPVGLR